jgi:hypothetical protein
MPTEGYISPDERRRLEQEAKIYAEAQRKMLREETARSERQREKREQEERWKAEREEATRRIFERNSTRSQQRTHSTLKERDEAIASAEKAVIHAMENSPEGITNRLAIIRASRVGSREYLQARYGADAYNLKYQEAKETYKSDYGYYLPLSNGWNEILVEMIAQSYYQNDMFWKSHECEQIEEQLGKEEHERADYEPKCEFLIEYIAHFKKEQETRNLMESRVNTIRSSETGTTEYLKARYGEHAYQTMLDTIIKELNLSEEMAADFLTENYSEALWKDWEDKDFERYLGNR